MGVSPAEKAFFFFFFFLTPVLAKLTIPPLPPPTLLPPFRQFNGQITSRNEVAASCSRENNSVPGGMPSRPPRKISNLCFDFISKSESCGKFALFARIISIWYDFPSSLSFPCATTQKQRFSTRRDILGEKYFLGWETIYIYIYVRFLDDRVPIHDGGTDRCGIQATSRRSRHKERVDARENGERERERKKKRRKRGRDNSVYNEGGIQIPAVPSGNERLTGTKGRKKKEKRISSWREDERRGEEGVKRAQRGRQGNISQSSKSWGHHEWVLEEGGENGI